jgi:hypothetical protein
MTALVGVGILAGVLASIAFLWFLVWFLAKSLPALLVLTGAFIVVFSWIIGAGALNQAMPPAGVMWFAFGSAFLLIWAIMEPPGTAGLWQTNGSPKEDDRCRRHGAA